MKDNNILPTPQQKTWAKAQATLRENRTGRGMKRADVWLEPDVYRVANDVAVEKYDGVLRDGVNALLRIAARHLGRLPAVGVVNTTRHEPALVTPSREQIRLADCPVDKLKKLAKAYQAKAARLYKARCELDPTLPPPTGKRGPDATERTQVMQVDKSKVKAVRKKIILTNRQRVTKNVEHWQQLGDEYEADLARLKANTATGHQP